MRKILLYLLLLFCQPCLAVVKTWNGGSSGSWNNGANWSPSGIPASATSPLTGDDIVFDGSIAGTVTITDYPAMINTDYWGQLSLINGVTLNLSSGSDTYMYFGTGLTINTGCRINIGAATTTIFEFGNKSAVLNSGLIYGTVELKGAGTNASTNRKYYTTAGRTRLLGKLILSAPAAQLAPAVNFGNFYIESGGELEWARDGVASAIPSFICLDGGTINVTGIVTTTVIFNNGGTYAGLIIWNCPAQTAQRLSIVPQVYPLLFHVDSIRVINTGSGSATLGSQPSYSVGHLEVQGGTMYLGSPVNANFGGQVITSDIKLTGGTLTGNATFAGDAGSAYPLTLPVNGNLIITGGTFNLTNRPTGLSPGGVMQLNIGGNILQSGGTIFSTSSFGSQNYLNMSGSGSQLLQLSNINDISLVIANTSASLGVALADNVTMPSTSALVLNRGYIKLNDFNLSLPASRFFQNAFSPMPRIVTNGYGKLKLTGIAASSTQLFPVAPLTVNSYDPVTITTSAAAISNDYAVRVARGISPNGIYYLAKTINRSWIISPATSITANTVGLSFQYNDTSANSLCSPTGSMELGHFVGSVWNVDPAATTLTPIGADPRTVGAFYPNSLDSAFAIGNQSSILAFNGVQVNYFTGIKHYDNHQLNWKITCNSTPGVTMTLERSSSSAGVFTIINTISATATRCAQPFNYTDALPLKGMNYYRLKIVDIDGKITYSNTIALLNAVKGFDIMNIAPNPVTGTSFKLNIASAQSTKLDVVITDMTGRIVNRQTISLINGYNIIDMNLGNLAKGTYNIYGITADDRSKAIRFVKQ